MRLVRRRTRADRPPFAALCWLSLLLVAVVPSALPAQRGLRQGERIGENAQDNEPQTGEEPPISDNSFLIEEAFNQEQGVVQHIFNLIPGWDRIDRRTSQNAVDFVFTQEWPLGSQRHQFSYTIPMTYAAERSDGLLAQAQGFGDIALNYRYQFWDGQGGLPAFAPRFSLILPTGETESGLGRGQPGYQIGLPLSKEFQHWAFHFNAGYTSVPGVKAGVDPLLAFEGRTLNGYNLGASAIRFVRPNFHLMLELVTLWDEDLLFHGEKARRFETVISPGFRWAPFTEKETQWVLGVGVPVGLTPDATDLSLFLYMSFEHRFARPRGEAEN